MTTQRALGILRSFVALAALALMLVALGLVLTSTAAAASSQPVPAVTPPTVATGGGDIVQFGEDVTVPAGKRVATLVAGGGDVTIDGTVTEDVVAFGGDVLVRGTVEGTVVCFGGDVRLASTAVVGSANTSQDPAIALIGGTLTREPGAQVIGDVQNVDNLNWGPAVGWVTKHTVVKPWWGFTLMGWIVQTAFFLVLGLIAAALMPRQMRALQRSLKLKPAPSLGWGALIFFVVGPAVLVVLVISIVGWLVLIPYGLLVVLAYFFATTTVAAFVAQRVLAGSKQSDNLMLAVTLGVIGTTVVSRIPVLGSLVIVAMILFGVGAGALALAEWRGARKQAAALAATGVPAPQGVPGPAAGPAPAAVAAPAGAPATDAGYATTTAAVAAAGGPATAATAAAPEALEVGEGVPAPTLTAPSGAAEAAEQPVAAGPPAAAEPTAAGESAAAADAAADEPRATT